MTAAEAIDSATIRPAEFVGLAHSVGTVVEGKIADLVLLDANPLVDIRNTRAINAVLLRGRLFDRPALDALLEAVAASEDVRVNDWPRVPAPPGGR
jgi:imidazolonepropionase-like amidohydrolase